MPRGHGERLAARALVKKDLALTQHSRSVPLVRLASVFFWFDCPATQDFHSLLRANGMAASAWRGMRLHIDKGTTQVTSGDPADHGDPVRRVDAEGAVPSLVVEHLVGEHVHGH